MIKSLQKPRLGPALLAALHAAALALFIRGFLLTRVHLPQRATAPTAAAAGGQAPYDRVVWLMIDALRYDFVVADGRYSCSPASRQAGTCHQGHMPFLSALAARKDGAARAFMFVADAPTTTTQRLKSLAAGSLPSFFDVSNSFTAGALEDDNLIDQLAAAGKRLAFLGDVTWQQLFPRQWAWSAPFPCFNVRDLHTTDDGVWAGLLPALRQPGAGSWDGLLVAHYLGVDHCGHTHGVDSQEMAGKLRQMDDHVRQVVAALLEGAAPGGPFARTLLLVSGDHGQTLGGDHGGGSPEEVDSVLVAVDVGALLAAGQNQQQEGQQQEGRQEGGASAASGLAAPAACRANCSCGVEGNQCAPDLPQMDLTPTLAAMLGVPIPFGNLGTLSPELWQLTQHAQQEPGSGSGSTDGGSTAQDAGGAGAAAWERSLAQALLANAGQVHAYLNAYAATAGASFSQAALAGLNARFAGLESADAGADVAATVARCQAFLETAAGVAREQWTQFGGASMAAGAALFAAAVLLHAAAAFGGSSAAAPAKTAGKGKQGGASAPASAGWLVAARQSVQGWQLVGRVGRWRLPVPTFRALLAATALVHGLGIFSFFYLLSEGKMVCGLVGAACLFLALSVGRATWSAGKRVRGVVPLAIMAVRCNALMALLGLAHHTGQGFWARLTVHEPQPAVDVERGWHSKLDRFKTMGARVLAAAGVFRLPPAVLAVGQHALLCTLPILALAAATERLLRGSRRGGMQWLLQLAAFASVAAYQHVEDATRQGLLPKAASLRQLMGTHLWPHLPTQLAAQLQVAAAAAAGPLAAAWPGVAEYGAGLLDLPLLDLLPHVTYALCAVLAAAWAAQCALRRLRGADAAVAAAQVLLAALLQVSDRQAPLILLLALLELVAIAKLLGRRAELLPAGSSASSTLRGVGGEAGALGALVASQLFFVSGHLCEFAGLQYTAGFVGSDEFHLWRSGALLALNTFGGMLLALLALPTVVQHVQAAAAGAPAVETNQQGDAAGGSSGGNSQDAARTAAKQRRSAAGTGKDEQASSAAGAFSQAVLTAGLVQALAGLCATLSAGLQRRHLYAWALFAPRFAFAACFLGLTDLILMLLSWLA